MEENKSIGFALVDIETEQFAILQEHIPADEKAMFDFSCQFRLDIENKLIENTINFDFIHNKSIFMKAVINCYFKIMDGTWNNLSKDNEIVFPAGFLTHLCVLTVGTSRGIIHAKTEKSSLKTFVLPTIDVRQVVTEDLAFALHPETVK